MAEEGKPAKQARDRAYYTSRFRDLIKTKKFNQSDGVDWLSLFARWVATDPSEYPTISHFLDANKVHRTSVAKRGGRTFWNEARHATRMEGVARAMEKAPDKLATRFDNLVRVQGKLEQAIEKLADKILADIDEVDAPTGDAILDRAARRDRVNVNSRMLENLKDIQNGLADISAKLGGNPNAGTPGVQVNLYQAIVEGLRQRDVENGVIDVEADRPAG